MKHSSDAIKIKAVEGRRPCLPNGGSMERGREYTIFPTPQTKRMLKDGDIVIVPPKKNKKEKEGE